MSLDCEVSCRMGKHSFVILCEFITHDQRPAQNSAGACLDWIYFRGLRFMTIYFQHQSLLFDFRASQCKDCLSHLTEG